MPMIAHLNRKIGECIAMYAEQGLISPKKADVLHAGHQYVFLQGIRGAGRGRSFVRVPRAFGEAELRFADEPSLPDRLLRGMVGDNHVAHNLRGLASLVQMLGDGLADHASQVGLEKYLEDYLATLEGKKRLPTTVQSFNTGRYHYLRWVREYARVHNMNIIFKGKELIPKEGHVVYVLGPHTSIYPDMMLPLIDEKMMPIADSNNFREDLTVRFFGFALCADLMGNPLVDRSDTADAGRRAYNLEMAMTHGLRTGWFPDSSRQLPFYNDDGTQDEERAGFFPNVLTPSKPMHFNNTFGAAANALELALRTGESVQLGFIQIHGAWMVMPRLTRRPPFIQENRVGRTVVYEVKRMMKIDPPRESRLKSSAAVLARAITAHMEGDSGILEYHPKIVERWGRMEGLGAGLGEMYRACLAAHPGDRRIPAIVDRTRVIPPSDEARGLGRKSVGVLLTQAHLYDIMIEGVLASVSATAHGLQQVA